jgi:hypothetical protein
VLRLSRAELAFVRLVHLFVCLDVVLIVRWLRPLKRALIGPTQLR